MKIQSGKIELHVQLLGQGNRKSDGVFGKFIGALTTILEEKFENSIPLNKTLLNDTFESLGLNPEYSHFVKDDERDQVLIMLFETWEYGERLRTVVKENQV